MVKTLPFPQALDVVVLPELNRNLFSSADWLTVLYNTYGLKLFVKYIEREGKIRSYILYSIVKNFLEWKVCICSYCDYCDCHVESLEDWKLFFESLREEYPAYRIAVRNLRDSIVREIPDMGLLSTERFHYLDIKDDISVLWQRTHDSFKAAVTQGQKKGVVVKICEKSELPKFYDLHLKVRRHKYRIFPQPYIFFDKIWRQYMDHDKGILLGAYDPEGRFIAGNIYLICGNTLYYKFNTSSHAALNLRPNNLLFWEGMKFAKERKLDCLDMGSSGNEQHGLILFKNHTGAKMMEIQHLGFTPANYKFSEKKILRTFTKVFTMPGIPDFMVKWGSHIIYPYLA